jgi:hypothetical protein
MVKMDESIKKGLSELLQKSQGLVLGSNDFFYTDHLIRHPCTEFLYLYGWYLKSLGVDTIFIENHYIDEPIQTRGFIGQVMYCAFLFGFRVVGLEFKGTTADYKEYTGKSVVGRVTTIAYDEPERLLRLNTVVKDIVEKQQKNKWILFCGMSHVGDTRSCKGIKTLLGVPGLGIQISGKNSIQKKVDFVDGRYRKETDYLIELLPEEKYSARLYVDSVTFSMMYAVLYFFSAYRNLVKVNRVQDLFKESKLTVYPLWYNDMVDWIMTTDPSLAVPDPDLVSSITFDVTREICPRDSLQSIREDMSEQNMSHIIDSILLFVEKDTPVRDYKSLMKMIFLEKKTLPLGKTRKDILSQLKKKFKKQIHRAENHLYELFTLMCVLKIPLPESKTIKSLF